MVRREGEGDGEDRAEEGEFERRAGGQVGPAARFQVRVKRKARMYGRASREKGKQH